MDPSRSTGQQDSADFYAIHRGGQAATVRLDGLRRSQRGSCTEVLQHVRNAAGAEGLRISRGEAIDVAASSITVAFRWARRIDGTVAIGSKLHGTAPRTGSGLDSYRI